MCTLHLIENGADVSIKSGRINVGMSGAEVSSVPIETVDGIKVYGKPRITTQCIETCMKKGIPISFFLIGWWLYRWFHINICECQKTETSVCF